MTQQMASEHGKIPYGINMESEMKEEKKLEPIKEVNGENIVIRVCEELNISQEELGESIDTPASTISRWKNGNIPKMASMYLNLLLEVKSLKDDFKIVKQAHKILLK